MEIKDCFKNSESLTDCLREKKFECKHMHESFFDLYQNVISKNISANRSFLNWLEKKPPTPSYLSGPCTLTKHTHAASPENGWTSDFCIYVFGELHGEKGCNEWNTFLKLIGSEKRIKDERKIMDIDNFLRDVANTSPVFLDIFIEMERETRENEERMRAEKKVYVCRYFIDRIRKMFRRGIAYIGEETVELEHMENVRIHAIDERLRHMNGFLGKFYGNDFKRENLRNKKIAHDFLTAIEDGLSIESSDEFINKFYMNDVLIKKEFDLLNEKHQNTVLTHTMDNWEMHNSDVFREAYQYFKKHTELINPMDETSMFDLYDYFHPIREFFMAYHVDMYFMICFLKGFSTIAEPRLPYNSIIYTGNRHSDNYRDFFKSLGFAEESLTRDDFIKNENASRYVERDVISHSKTKDGSTTVRASRCMHINEKKMYPMFGVSSCGF